MGDELNVFDVQKILRHHSEQYGLDITDPHGIKVHGKLYPTVSKRLFTHNTPSYRTHVTGVVPLESGNMLNIRSFHYPNERPYSHEEREGLNGVLMVPVTAKYAHSAWRAHSYAEPFNQVRGKGIELTSENVHDFIKEMSKEPFGGLVRPKEAGSDLVEMTPEEFKEHREAFSKLPYSTYTYDHVIIHPNPEVGMVSSHFNNHLVENNKAKDLLVPKGQIHVTQRVTGGGSSKYSHYAYDPESERLAKLAEWE